MRTRSRGFTIIELLVVIAIIAILASLLFPTLVKAKGRSKDARCASNLRQLYLATEVYIGDSGDAYPFSGSHWTTQHFIEYYSLMSPYLNPVEDLFLCPADQGPQNHVASIYFAIRARQLPLKSSYEFHPAFYTRDFFSQASQQRFAREVSFPAQKGIYSCLAIKTPREVFGMLTRPEGHGNDRSPILFADGHSAVTQWRRIHFPTNQPALIDWTPLHWRDID
jgi:prepilin-type N-terminal cleavage/methylation domain-containing protein/prepilin-type processing-associated H-X9-DG protein